MENTGTILTILEEKINTKDKPTERELKLHTKWIAKNSLSPLITGIFGGYINSHCHVLEAYSQPFLESLNK